VSRSLKSSPAPSRAPIRIATFALLAVFSAGRVVAQGADRTSADTPFHKEPGGTLLGRLSRGAAVTFGATRNGWREVTLTGWVPANTLRNDSRDGFDVAVSLAAGVSLRTTASNDAPVRATAVAGALFDRAEARSGWVLVSRKAWIPLTAAATTTVATPPPAALPPPAAAATPTATTPVVQDSAPPALSGGSEFSADRGGPPIGRLESSRGVEIVERSGGWSRVRLEVWVPDAAVGAAPTAGISGAELRAAPERYVGQAVEWRLQVLAVREADDLRPELPKGQPYVLARGPLPETGFVYLSVPASEAAVFRAMEPLSEVRVRATIRAGRSRFLPTPVLDFVRRLD
jgi:hypothetical protein